MSDKLIKASDAVDVVAKHSALYGNGEVSTDEGEALLYDIMSEITNLPSAQPEIIHCENCKNWQTGWRNREWGLGYHWCSCVDGIRRSDWFCADAERRADETD